MNLVASSERTQRRLRQCTILGVLCFALLMQPQVTIALRPPTIAPPTSSNEQRQPLIGAARQNRQRRSSSQRTVARLSDRRLLVMIDAPAKLISDRRGANSACWDLAVRRLLVVTMMVRSSSVSARARVIHVRVMRARRRHVTRCCSGREASRYQVVQYCSTFAPQTPKLRPAAGRPDLG